MPAPLCEVVADPWQPPLSLADASAYVQFCFQS